jgi:hypothetical protein
MYGMFIATRQNSQQKLFHLRSCKHYLFLVISIKMKSAVFWDVTPVALLRLDVWEESIASIIRIEGTALAVTNN